MKFNGHFQTSKKVEEWIEDQGDIYGSWFYDWIQEGDLIDANIWRPHHDGEFGWLFEQGVQFGTLLAEHDFKAFRAGPYFDDTEFYFFGDEDEVLDRLKKAWAEEFDSDDPPLTEAEQKKVLQEERLKDKITSLEEQLKQLKSQQ